MAPDRTTLGLAGLAVLVTALAATLIYPEPTGTPLAAAAVWAGCLAFLASAAPHGVLSLPCLYLVLLGLFHLGLVVPEALGVGPESPPPWARSPHLPAALGLFNVAVLAFTVGARLARGRDLRPEAATRPRHVFFVVGLAFAAAGGALLWAGILRMGLLRMAYAEFFVGARQDVRTFGFGLMLFPIGVIIAAMGATPGRMPLLGAIFAAVLGPVFLSGFRGPVLVQGAALLAVWARKDARAARRIAAGGLVAMSLLVPAVKIARNAGSGLWEAARETRLLTFVHESGGSLLPLVVTYEQIGLEAEPLWMGRSYLMAATRIVPNLSTRWEAPGKRALTPGVWATMHANYWGFEQGFGIGYSGVAEPYLNFGTPGVVGFFLLLGFLLRSGDAWLSRGGHRAAIVAASFGFLLWSVRNDTMAVPRAIAWASVAVAIAWWIARYVRRHSASPGDDAAPPRTAPGAPG